MGYLDTLRSSINEVILKLPGQYFKYFVWLTLVAIGIIVGAIINKILDDKKIYKLKQKVDSRIKENLKNNTSDSKTSYEKIDEKLSRLGNKYRSKGSMTPEKYFLYKIITCVVIGSAGFFIEINGVPTILTVIIAGCMGWVLPDMLSESRNKKDNSEMSDDLKALCDTFYIQSKVGRSIENILLEIYLQTRNPRLKRAVMELNVDLLDRSNVEEKIDNFNRKFKNEVIDRICIILKQAEKSGYSTEFFKVVSEEIKNITTIEQMAEKEKLNTTVMLLEVGIFIAIFAALLFMVMHDTSAGIAVW